MYLLYYLPIVLKTCQFIFNPDDPKLSRNQIENLELLLEHIEGKRTLILRKQRRAKTLCIMRPSGKTVEPLLKYNEENGKVDLVRPEFLVRE